MLPNFVFKNTITYIHATLIRNQPIPIKSLFKVYTFIYEAIFVIVQVHVVKTTKYTTSNSGQDSKFKPWLQPQRSKLCNFSKKLPQPMPKILPKTIQRAIWRFFTLAFLKQTIVRSSPQHSKNHIGQPWEPSTQWHSSELMALTTTTNLSRFDQRCFILNKPMSCTYWLLIYLLVVTHNAPQLYVDPQHDLASFDLGSPARANGFVLIDTSFSHCT